MDDANRPSADTTQPSPDDILADFVARYEESLAKGVEPADFDLTAIASDPELLQRWQGVKSCVDMMHRVQRTATLDQTPATDYLSGSLESALLSGLGLPKSLGRFQILRRLGAGGVGLVYLAKDLRLGRLVALKVPRLETLDNADLRNRFLREAEAAARLSHPNVVPVLESGQDDLLCYIAAEYCEGPTLAEWLRDHDGKVPVRQAAIMIRQLSSAVQHAHSRGVLHRDIKPGNVLLVREVMTREQPAGALSLTPKLTDFGMAKLLENSGYDETRTGATIGTPAYMAPEQAAGRVRELDSRADVYALGAVLYELLTGLPPFPGDMPIEVLRRVLDEDPTPVRKLRTDVPVDLEAICLKCLAKRPADRYQTAQQLADDLDRFLAHEPILARPPGPLESLGKWARRHPLAMGATAIIAGALVVLTIVTSIYNTRLSTAIVRADREAETSRQLLYSANVQLAQQSLLRGNVRQTLDLLQACVPQQGQSDLREFSWHYLQAACNQQSSTLVGHDGAVFAVAYSPDGSTLASVGIDGTVRLWDSQSGQPRHVLRGHASEVTCVAFASTGDLLATGSEDQTVRLWNWRTGAAVHVLESSEDHVLAIAFSPDGRMLASGGRSPFVRVWNCADFSLAAEISSREYSVRALQFSADGSKLLAADNESQVHLWATDDWRELATTFRTGELYFALAVTSKASLVAAAGRKEQIEVFSLSKEGLHSVTEIFDAHLGWIQTLAFNPAGTTLASSGKDGAVRLWSCENWRVQRTLTGHSKRIWSVAWSPDGKSLASAGDDGQIRIWKIAGAELRRFPDLASNLTGLADAARGDALLSCNRHGLVELWNGTPPNSTAIGRLGIGTIARSEISPDKKLLAAATEAGELQVWQLDGLKQLWKNSRLDVEGSEPLAWSSDSSLLAGHLDRRVATLFDARTGKLLKQLNVGERLWGLAFMPDNSLVISTGAHLRRWDHVHSRILWELGGAHHLIAISPDGRYVVSDQEARISVIDGQTGKPLGHLVTEGEVRSLTISPDSRTLAVGVGPPSQMELWELSTIRQLVSIPMPPNFISLTSFFTADGRRLLASGYDRTTDLGWVSEWTTSNPTENAAGQAAGVSALSD